MGNVRFKLDKYGLRAVMKSDWMQGKLQTAGDAVADIAEGNYGVRVHEADYVAIANVYPDDKESAKRNLQNNELMKALGAAGLPMGK